MSASLPERNLSNGSLFMSVVRTHVRQILFTRRTATITIVQLLPAIFALVYVIFQDVDGLAMFDGITRTVIFPFLVPLAAMFFGGPAIVDEMEGRTLTYLTLRPVHKANLFLGKLVGSIAVALPVVLLPVIALFLVCQFQSDDFGAAFEAFLPIAGAASIGVIAYTTIFAALGAIVASSLLAGILYFVTFEIVLAGLPVLELLSVRYYLRVIAGLDATDRMGFFDRLVLDQPLVLENWVGWAVVAIATLAFGFAGAWVFTERQYHV
jgi:ABC-type transport system involved in multi-copper enzyme maturation permease subunit